LCFCFPLDARYPLGCYGLTFGRKQYFCLITSCELLEASKYHSDVFPVIMAVVVSYLTKKQKNMNFDISTKDVGEHDLGCQTGFVALIVLVKYSQYFPSQVNGF